MVELAGDLGQRFPRLTQDHLLAVYSAFYGFSSSHAMRLLHFLGIVYAYSVVMSIPNAIRGFKAEPTNQTEQSVSANGV